jgi:hypothetical protein
MKIEFYTLVDGIELAYPPIPISEVPMRWVKKTQENLRTKFKTDSNPQSTGAHLCSGIRNLISIGYAITAWHDIEITTNGDGAQFTWYVPNTNAKHCNIHNEPISLFYPEEYGEYAVLPPETLKSIIKIPTPWRVRMPKGWGLMMLPLHYADENRFTSLVGVLDPEISSVLNAVLYWHRLNEKTLIKAGTPLFYVVPVKLDDKLDVVIRTATEKEKKWEEVYQTVAGCSFKNGVAKVKGIYDKFWSNKS